MEDRTKTAVSRKSERIKQNNEKACGRKNIQKNACVNYQCAWSFDVLSLEKEAVPYYGKAISGDLNNEDMQGVYVGIGKYISYYRQISGF